ncbi:MAG: hypothetical protein LC107_03170 [Chitinophagales bacterium]|nr:hypothetical protein [Chitinophagales bacterium]
MTFHYKGRLRNANDLPRFLEEVEDIANILNWPYDVFESTYPIHQFVSPINDQTYGIIVMPPDSEPIYLTFDSEGRLFNPNLKEMLDKNQDGEFKVITIHIDLNEDEISPIIREDDKDADQMEIIYSLSVTTENAEIETHAKLVELLKYLSKTYFEDFKIIDETQYPNNKSMDDISHKLEDINRMIEMFQDAMEGKDINSPEDFIKFIKSFSQKLKKNKE